MEQNEISELKMSETNIPVDFLYNLYEFASYQYISLWGLCYGISKHFEIKISPLESDELLEMVCKSVDLVDPNVVGTEVLNTIYADEIEELGTEDGGYYEKNYEREVRPSFYYE